MKTKFFLSRIWLVMLVVALGLSAAFGIAYATNMLNNGGVNGTYVSQAGIIGTVPQGWTAVNIVGNPTYIDSFTECGCGGNNEKTEGDNAVYIRSQDIETPPTPGKPFDSVMYQQVSSIVSGTAYGFAASIVTFCGGTGGGDQCQTGRDFRMWKSVGIDPTGGTAPTATTVVWSEENGRNAAEFGTYYGYQDLSVAARAQSDKVTVFVRVRWPHQFHGALAYWDAAYLGRAPVATMTAPLTSTGAINMSWTGQMPDVSDYWGGPNPAVLGYDVQVRDTTVTTWTQLLTTTELVQTTFTGQVGHSYQLRVLPVIFQRGGNPGDSPTRRMVGLFTEPMTVTVVDITPPSSAVAALPTYSLAPTFTVRWTGSDNVSASNTLTYDVQVRDGAGAWTDLLTNTTNTVTMFTGQAGHTYYFRSRATDQANNVEAYPTSPDYDAFTTIPYAITGRALNIAERPIALATLILTPTAAVKGVSWVDGQYAIYVTATGAYSLTASRSEYTTPPPLTIIVTDNLANVNVYLLPKLEAVTNGQFEQGNLHGWSSGGSLSPAITPNAYSGNFAVALGMTNTVGGDSSLQQTLYVPSTSSSRIVDTTGMTPTLSFFYRAPITTNVPFTLTLSNGVTQTTTTPAITSNAWTHGMFDLSSFMSQTITITFAMRQLNGGELLYLDNLSVGRAETVIVHAVYLPLIMR